MSEEREEGRVPEERAQSASASGASSSQTPPAQDISLRFKILEREKIIVGGCFWATLANIYCAKEHEKADKDWNTVIMNRNEWPADLDWLILLNLLSRQEKDKHGIIGYRIEKKYDEGGKVRYVYPSDDKPVEGTVVARILHVWEVAGTAKAVQPQPTICHCSRQPLLMIVKKPPYLAAKSQY